jgi:5-enolpyruvylshikimate-3-phosphate synthase
MSFSLASFLGDITINDPGCVNKTYPDYFNDFEEYIS